MSQLDLSPEALTGRARELGFLQGFARETAVSGGALMLSGDPGMGKTALLGALADSALSSGMTVLRGAGLEFEGEVSFATLNQALFPLLGDLGELASAPPPSPGSCPPECGSRGAGRPRNGVVSGPARPRSSPRPGGLAADRARRRAAAWFR